MIINPYIFSQPTPLTDAYIDALIAIGGSPSATKINKLKAFETGAGTDYLISKFKRFTVAWWDDASLNRINFMNPASLDSAFRLEFFGGWTHAGGVATPNGTNAYARTFFIDRDEMALTDGNHLSYFSTSDTNTGLTQADTGYIYTPEGTHCWLSAWYNADGFNNAVSRNTSPSILLDGGVVSASTGWYITTNDNGTGYYYRDTTLLDSETIAIADSPIESYVGALNLNGAANYHTNRPFCLSTAGPMLTSSDVSTLSPLITTLFS